MHAVVAVGPDVAPEIAAVAAVVAAAAGPVVVVVVVVVVAVESAGLVDLGQAVAMACRGRGQASKEVDRICQGPAEDLSLQKKQSDQPRVQTPARRRAGGSSGTLRCYDAAAGSRSGLGDALAHAHVRGP